MKSGAYQSCTHPNDTDLEDSSIKENLLKLFSLDITELRLAG